MPAYKERVASKQEDEVDEQQPARAQKVGQSAINSAQVDEVVDDIDALLDEIDETLEENAEKFVEEFIQKGGQ